MIASAKFRYTEMLGYIIYASTYLVLSINISSMSNENFHCMGMASHSSPHYNSCPILYGDEVSLGESEL